MLDVVKLVEQSHRIAVEHGWWDEEQTIPSPVQPGDKLRGAWPLLDHNKVLLKVEEKLVLISGELVGEAFEEVRRSQERDLRVVFYDYERRGVRLTRPNAVYGETPVPVGFLIEAADAVIRICDLAGAMQVGETVAAAYTAGHDLRGYRDSTVAHQLRCIERTLSRAWPVYVHEQCGEVADYDNLAESLGLAIGEIEQLALLVGATEESFAEAIAVKAQFNKSREFRHGSLRA